MIGFALAFVVLALTLVIPLYSLNSVWRAKKQRRQQMRLAAVYDRAVLARKHGLPPLLVGAGLLSGRLTAPVRIRTAQRSCRLLLCVSGR